MEFGYYGYRSQICAIPYGKDKAPPPPPSPAVAMAYLQSITRLLSVVIVHDEAGFQFLSSEMIPSWLDNLGLGILGRERSKSSRLAE